MKTKGSKKNKVNIITLGCSKNMVDSEVLSGQLIASDIDVAHVDGNLNDNEKEYILKIRRSAQRMSLLISELLNFSILLRPRDDEVENIDLNGM